MSPKLLAALRFAAVQVSSFSSGFYNVVGESISLNSETVFTINVFCFAADLVHLLYTKVNENVMLILGVLFLSNTADHCIAPHWN